jgi:endonuclease/exonuclease/phosphatase family metal-dependent hydrolase
LPVLLVGDFNAAAGANKAYEILTSEDFLTDTWITAGERINEQFGTFHNFQGPKAGGRIDWILTRGAVRATKAEIMTCSSNGQYPSDHFPVLTWLQWGRR